MKRADGADPETLPPETWCPLSEAQWFACLESCEPLHQWGSAFLVEHEGGGIKAYVRDDSGGEGHAVLHLGAPASARARAGVEEVEAAARACADLITAAQARESSSLDQVRREDEAGLHFTGLATALYRELLRRDD